MKRLLAVTWMFLAASAAGAEPWPGWRGPTGMGQSTHKDLPLTWVAKDPTTIAWKMALVPPGEKVQLDKNQSSPVVIGERVFVTHSWWPAKVDPKTQCPEHHVICFRVSDGKRLWDTTVPAGPWQFTDIRGGYTAPTPATDGERIYVLFGSAVLAALDMEGTIVWRKEIKPHFFDVAIGTSPVLYRDTVLVMCDQIKDKKASVLRAFDRKTGETAWEAKRPDADWTHSTPVLADIDGKTQLLVAGANRIEGLDPDNGKPIWWVTTEKRVGDTVSPVVGGGLLYCDCGRGGLGGPGYAVDPTGRGDVTKTHVKWKNPKLDEGFSSPVIVGDYLYRLQNPGILKCWELATGKLMYAERLEGISTSSSPVATADGRIYCASAGRSFVVRAGPKFELLATNDLNDASQASPAVADGMIYLKGREYLWCIGKR
jgi:outer membrane protein assembly factor BamB